MPTGMKASNREGADVQKDGPADSSAGAPIPSVLVAEDDSELRRLLAEKLRRDGYRVDEAKSGMELFERIEEMDRQNLSYDLIITDIRMPGLTGMEVIDGLAADGVFDMWTTRVIFISAFGDGATRMAADRLQAPLIDKPFDIDALRSCAAEMIRRGQKP